MALDATQIKVAKSGHLYVAPYGTVLPANPTTALNAAFVDLGYITEDGATFNNEPTTEDIGAWQKNTAVMRLVTGRSFTLSAAGMQWNKDTFATAFGGGTWTEPTDGVYRYDPPADTDELPNYSVVLDSVMGDRHDRIVIYKGNVTDAVETQLQRTAASTLPFTFSALTPDDEDAPWYYLSDDPAFEIAP